MRLTKLYGPGAEPPWKYGHRPRSMALRYLRAFRCVCAMLIIGATSTARAQQANQPGFDPRQPEKHFDNLQSGRTQPPSRPPLRMPTLATLGTVADARPQFVLRGVSLQGASAIPREQLATSYQPYLGRQVSQADLAAIAAAITGLYRAAGF